MNWDSIKKKYPKAHKLFRKWVYFGMDNTTQRLLYDFFDEQDLNIAVLPFFSSWIWKIRYEDMNFIEGEKKETTRTEAEEQAFLKAFEILENKLRGNT